MNVITLKPIGYVRNRYTESQSPEQIKRELSQIEVFPQYAIGLNGVEEQSYLDVFFILHQEKRVELMTRIRSGEVRGIFSTRSPKRPNHLGVTTVKLLNREGNVLQVQGADALDGSPVVDIKCCDTSLFQQHSVHQSIQVAYPRADIVRNILDGDSFSLLLQAAQLHGHICPGLALGVMSGMAVMQRILENDHESREYLLTIEMQNCPVDGVLFVTGCTPGRNRFLFGDLSKNSFTIQDRQGEGWTVYFHSFAQEFLNQQLPPHLPAIERGIKTLSLEDKKLFRIYPIKR